jgi:hypothetical protein
MKFENLYHTGLVFDEIEPVMEWFSKTGGYKWCEIATSTHEVETPAGKKTVNMKVAYSMSVPRIEMIQTVPGTLWVPTGAGVHHLGYWSDDIEAEMDKLQKSGLELEMKNGKGMTVSCYFSKKPNGPRIELVNTAIRPYLEEMFATGRLMQQGEGATKIKL